jgi:hypothetical protein
MSFSPKSTRSGTMCVSLWNDILNQVINSTYDDRLRITPPCYPLRHTTQNTLGPTIDLESTSQLALTH